MDYWELEKISLNEDEIPRSVYADNTGHYTIISEGGTGWTLYWDIDDKVFSAHVVEYSSGKIGGNSDDDEVCPMMSWYTTRINKPELKYVEVYELGYMDVNVMIKTMQETLRIMNEHWSD